MFRRTYAAGWSERECPHGLNALGSLRDGLGGESLLLFFALESHVAVEPPVKAVSTLWGCRSAPSGTWRTRGPDG